MRTILQKSLKDSIVKCQVCPHYCVLKPGDIGKCQVRKNKAGEIVLLYENLVVATHIDPIEKKPLYHFLRGTTTYSIALAGCNMKCPWCQNYAISQIDSSYPRHQTINPQTHIENAIKSGCNSISYTYSEPTIYLEHALETMKLAKQHNLKNVWVTNGFFTKETREKILPFVDAFNIDLKAADDHTYKTMMNARLDPVLDNIKALYKAKKHLEITTLIIPGMNDSTKQLNKMGELIKEYASTDVPWHLSRFFPSYLMKNKPKTPRKTMKKAKYIADDLGFKNSYLGNMF
ncbi:MAG: AmmeMemoRadiSam system radical SAM enzyme [Candidatus Izimaplasma sp.]|nr:AmmeMemoRadiSam system radical SAM enzyme [Candidatus Izimaplasma bacterium]